MNSRLQIRRGVYFLIICALQMPAQYSMNPSMGTPGYGYPAPAQNYAQMGYQATPYMQPHNYANMGFNQYHQYGTPPMGPHSFGAHQGQMYPAPGGSFGNKQFQMDGFGSHGGSAAPGSMAGVPSGGGRGRGRGKSSKGRMSQGYGPQGGMQGDGYGASQGYNFEAQSWMQNPRQYDTGFAKDKQGVQPQFGGGGYQFDPQQFAGYGQYPPAAQYTQQHWPHQSDKFPGPKGGY